MLVKSIKERKIIMSREPKNFENFLMHKYRNVPKLMFLGEHRWIESRTLIFQLGYF